VKAVVPALSWFSRSECDDFNRVVTRGWETRMEAFSFALAVVITTAVIDREFLRIIQAHPEVSKADHGYRWLTRGVLEWWRVLSPDYWRCGPIAVARDRTMEVVRRLVYVLRSWFLRWTDISFRTLRVSVRLRAYGGTFERSRTKAGKCAKRVPS